MGTQLFDQYSLLHFAVGIVAHFWGISRKVLFFSHIVFELVENTQVGMTFINSALPFWPGGKPKADSLLNMVGDTLSASLGWYCAQLFVELVGNAD